MPKFELKYLIPKRFLIYTGATVKIPGKERLINAITIAKPTLPAIKEYNIVPISRHIDTIIN